MKIERIDVPKRFSDLAERRTRDIWRACWADANPLRTLMLSCYLQGLEDGYETARIMPDHVAADVPPQQEHGTTTKP